MCNSKQKLELFYFCFIVGGCLVLAFLIFFLSLFMREVFTSRDNFWKNQVEHVVSAFECCSTSGLPIGRTW